MHSERNHIVVRRRLLRPKAALLTFAVLTGVVWTLSAQSNPLEERRSKLRSLEAEEYEYELRTHPERATKYGDDRFNDRLADYSVQFFESDLKQKQRFLDRAKAIDTTGFPEQEALNKTLLVYVLQLQVDGMRFKPWEMPTDILYGPQVTYTLLPTQTQFRNMKDYDNYLSRLRQYRRVFDSLITLMQAGMQDHLMQPRFILEKIAGQAQAVADTKPENTTFAEPVSHFPQGVRTADRKRIHDAALEIVQTEVLPAYSRFAQFILRDYAPHGRTEAGIWSLPDGNARYLYAVRQMTTARVTPEQIHQIGLDQVAKLEAEMLSAARRLGYPDIQRFHRHIREDPSLYATSGEQLLQRYRRYMDQMYAKASTLFGHLPKAKLVVVPIESFRAAQSMPAEYFPGSEDGSRPGHLNVNMYAPEKRLLLNSEAIAYHEGMPGHHLQISLQFENMELPTFRRQSPYENYCYAAFVEGWGLYAEQLAKDAGFYQDPYSDYGRLESLMWRAIRLVVDTGVHYKHWTREQMVDYFRQHTAMDELNIQSEVDRYIAWPAQGLSYMLGEMEIMQLRGLCQKKLGDNFDIRSFHDEVLGSGALPLDILDARMKTWVARQAVEPGTARDAK